jgi:hypothetical protein
MAKEYKTLHFYDTLQGRKKMSDELDRLSKEGWELKSKEVVQQGWSTGSTCCLGCIFLPLALLGKKDNIITIIMERDVQEEISDKQ